MNRRDLFKKGLLAAVAAKLGVPIKPYKTAEVPVLTKEVVEEYARNLPDYDGSIKRGVLFVEGERVGYVDRIDFTQYTQRCFAEDDKWYSYFPSGPPTSTVYLYTCDDPSRLHGYVGKNINCRYYGDIGWIDFKGLCTQAETNTVAAGILALDVTNESVYVL